MAWSRAEAKREATASPVEEGEKSRVGTRHGNNLKECNTNANQDNEVPLEKGGGWVPVETREAMVEGSATVDGAGKEDI
jgi:hypothetical protein